MRRPKVNEFLFQFMPEEEWDKFDRDSRIAVNGDVISHPIEANIWQMKLENQVEYLKSIAVAGCNLKEEMPQEFVSWIYWKLGDKIAEKHGAYSSVYWDVLDESEKDMIEDIPMDEEMLLIEQIQLFAVRERRIMAAINKYRNMNGEVSLFGFARTEDKRAFKSDEDKQLYEERIEEKVASGDRLPGNTYNMMTNMENKDNMIARLEKELSTVQSKKTKAIEALAKLRLEKQKIAGESKGNEVVRAWAEAVVKARREEKHDG